MRKCQESGVAVSTDAARALSKLKHDENYSYHGSHGHAHDSEEYLQHFHDLENVYELGIYFYSQINKTLIFKLLIINSLDAQDVLNWSQRLGNWESFILLLTA